MAIVVDDPVVERTTKLRLNATAMTGDGILQATPGTTVGASYGFGYLARRASIRP